MADLVGQTLGRYRIEAKLGEGGMGVVYRATDDNLRRRVALKVLPESVTRDAERRRRFLREARSAAAIMHANVAAVFDVGEADGHVYIVMELVEGETLRSRLKTGPLSVDEAVRIGKHLARGLGKAHEKDIVHRDLKPENVILAPDGTAKILDFGLAKLREAEAAQDESAIARQETETHVTLDGHVLGTPGYMSPEQAAGRPIDARSDLFSLGTVLYEMVTASRPFVGSTSGELLAAIQRDEPRPPSKANPGVDAGLDRLILRCLRKAPGDRYASAAELLADLEGWRAGSRPRASRRGLAAAGVVTAALLLGVVAWRAGTRPASSPSSSSTSQSPSASTSPSAATPTPRATTLLDLPPPATTVPQAATEYAAGMQAQYDNSQVLAEKHFTRAAELDPSMAAAHLRIALTAGAVPAQAAFATAAALRSQLSERDRTLMEALEPWLQRTPRNAAEAVARLQRASERFPLDVEFLDWWSMLGNDLAVADRAIALDPKDGQAWQWRGGLLMVLGREDEARESFERCAGLSVDSVDCLLSLAELDSSQGRCADLEEIARRARDRDPSWGRLLALAMQTNGEPDRAVREVLGAALATPLGETSYAPRLALFSGDFAQVESWASDAERRAATLPELKTDYRVHADIAAMRVQALLETGDAAGAQTAASDFVLRQKSLLEPAFSEGYLRPAIWFERIAFAREGRPTAEFESRRSALVDAGPSSDTGRMATWVTAYATTAMTAEEARSALDALPRFALPAPSDEGSAPAIGRVYLLANRIDDALPYLRRAVASCDVDGERFDHTRAALDLGLALEQKGDKPGACEAYAKVLSRWGNARPRSVTADKARQRVKALGCAPAR